VRDGQPYALSLVRYSLRPTYVITYASIKIILISSYYMLDLFLGFPYFWLILWTTALGKVVAYIRDNKKHIEDIDKRLTTSIFFCISSYGIRIRNTLFVGDY
jgi:hypothetical protein